MKKLFIVIAMLSAFGGAQATESTSQNQTSQAGPIKVDTTNNTQSQSSAVANGGSNGNQSMVFAPVYNTPSTQTVTQNVNQSGTTTQNIVQSGTTNQNVNQTVNGTQTVINKGETTSNVNYGGTQNVNQNVSGEQTVNNNVNGTQTQIVQGGTNSTMHQTFGTQKIKNTPSVSGPPLTASNDTCMGSASGSANGPGFGISVGKTYTDDNCVMLKNSRELWNMGMKAASMALMCMDKNNREALEMTGFECPQTARDNGRKFTAEVN